MTSSGAYIVNKGEKQGRGGLYPHSRHTSCDHYRKGLCDEPKAKKRNKGICDGSRKDCIQWELTGPGG